jgi:hypothetical protein
MISDKNLCMNVNTSVRLARTAVVMQDFEFAIGNSQQLSRNDRMCMRKSVDCYQQASGAHCCDSSPLSLADLQREHSEDDEERE